MILRPEIAPTDPQEVLDYYKSRYSEVHIITCKKCKHDLGIEVAGEVSGLPRNELGRTVIPVHPNLLSSRVRLDGMAGYQCACGNDTRSCDIEEACSPTGTFLPHEIDKTMTVMAESGWEAPIKQVGNKEHRDTFVAERIS